MRRRLLCATPLGLAGGAGGSQAQPLRLFADDSYAPLIYRQQGQACGLLVDLLRRVERLSGERYQLELVPWARAIALAARGLGGVIGASRTEQRSHWLDFSAPLVSDDVQLLVRRGNAFRFDELGDLRGKLLGGALGACYGEAIDRGVRSGLFRLSGDWGLDKRLRMLAAGRTDAALIGSGSAGLDAALQRFPALQALRQGFEWLPRPLTRDPLYLALPRIWQRQDSIERFNRALRRA